MSVHKEGREGRPPLTHPERRCFLRRATAAAVGVSAGILPLESTGVNAENRQNDCANVKTPMAEVKGKGAFITGGSSGIGLGIAQAFVKAGMKVVIGYRTENHLEQANKILKNAGDRVHAIQVDVTDRQGMEQAAAKAQEFIGKIHVLVNNAGVLVVAPLSTTTYEDWDWIINVNLNGVFNGVHAFLPRIQSHGEGGQIIGISSITGLIADGRSYSVSKFGVVAMMEGLRAELIDTNIGVSVCCPGMVKSNILDSNRNRPAGSDRSGLTSDSATSAWLKQALNDPQLAMSAAEVGQLVLGGMRNNDLYILTHPEFEQLIQDRGDAIIASIPRHLRPTKERLSLTSPGARKSIYLAERNRKLCAQATRSTVSK